MRTPCLQTSTDSADTEHNWWSADGKMILMDAAFLQELGHFLLDEDDNDESSDESEKNLMTVVKAARKTQACFLLSHWKTRCNPRFHTCKLLQLATTLQN